MSEMQKNALETEQMIREGRLQANCLSTVTQVEKTVAGVVRNAQQIVLNQVTLTLEELDAYQLLSVKLNSVSIDFGAIKRSEMKLQGLHFTNKPVVISGKMPLWLAANLTHRIHSNAPAILVYVPQSKSAVVIAAHSREFVEGQILPIAADLTVWD